MTARLNDKIILITGASRGIGASVAVHLASLGAHLVLVARSVDGLERTDDAITAAGGKATLVPLNLAEHERIDSLGAALLEKFGRLDGFIGNAALLGKLSPLTHMTPKSWQELLDVNLTANWRLIRILDPLLRRSEAPRAAFVTSGVTQMHAPYWGGYAVSKTALEMLALTYAAENTNTALRVNLIDPSVVATDMRAQAFPGEDKTTLMQADDPRLLSIFAYAMSDACNENGQKLHKESKEINFLTK